MTNEQVAIEITKHREEIGSLKHRMDKAEQQNATIQELVTSVQELAINMQHMIKEQERQNKTQEQAIERIDRLEEVPAKRWDSLTTVIITALASGVITYILTSILK